MRNQNTRKRKQHIQLIIHLVLVAIIAFTTIRPMANGDANVSRNTTTTTLHTQELERENIKETSSTELQEVITVVHESTYPHFVWSKDWSAEDSYLLAKIAMAEAEGESLHTKTLVILTVLNRVWHEDFPNTIEDVIFEKSRDGVYQFSPVMPGGRWWTTEPNEECYEAVEKVMTATYDYSKGALYFESCKDEDNWHSRNLEFLYKSDSMRFYK